MSNKILSIVLDKLIVHPDNPNRMSRSNFAKLVRNIRHTGRYEPLIVRPHPQRKGFFEIINGHHRCRALEVLGYKQAECIVWDIDDEQADILLATLNRLGGTDELGKKLFLLKRLNEKLDARELSRLLPQTAKQIARLVNLHLPDSPAKVNAMSFATPFVFCVSDSQQKIVETALFFAEKSVSGKTKAQKKAAALTYIAQYFNSNYIEANETGKIRTN